MRTYKPKIKKQSKGKSLEWVSRRLSEQQRRSLKNLYDIKTDGELLSTIRFAKTPNKVIWEACRLLKVKLQKNAFDENRRKPDLKKRTKRTREGKNLKNGYGRFSKDFGKLSN